MSEHKIGTKTVNAMRKEGITRIGCSDIFVSHDKRLAEIIERETGVRELIAALRNIEARCLNIESNSDDEIKDRGLTYCMVEAQTVLKKYGAQ